MVGLVEGPSQARGLAAGLLHVSKTFLLLEFERSNGMGAVLVEKH